MFPPKKYCVRGKIRCKIAQNSCFGVFFPQKGISQLGYVLKTSGHACADLPNVPHFEGQSLILIIKKSWNLGCPSFCHFAYCVLLCMPFRCPSFQSWMSHILGFRGWQVCMCTSLVFEWPQGHPAWHISFNCKKRETIKALVGLFFFFYLCRTHIMALTAVHKSTRVHNQM